MKKKKLNAWLVYENNQPLVYIQNGRVITIEELEEILKGETISQNIDKIKKIESSKYTKYVVEGNDYNEKNQDNTKFIFDIKVKPSQKKYFKSFLSSIENMKSITTKVRIYNNTKLTALVVSGALIITSGISTLGYGFAKAYKDEIEYQSEKSREGYERVQQAFHPTEEELKEAEKLSKEQELNDILKRLESGDNEAIGEYYKFLLQEEAENQKDNYEEDSIHKMKP